MLAILLAALCVHSVAISVPEPLLGSGASRVVASPEPREPGEGGPHEYRIKAAFLYNFVRFTTWPKSALGKKDDPITILIVGKDQFDDHLTKAFKDKTLHDRKVVIEHVTEVPKHPKGQLIFACSLTRKEEHLLIERCEGKPILLVGDRKGFAAEGACANFFLEDKRVRFEVNTGEVKAAKLTISSQLLKLAQIVKTTGEKR